MLTGQWVTTHCSFQPREWIQIEDIKRKYENNYKLQNDVFLDCWFGDSGQKLMIEALHKF